ncbi:hypothetical protein E3N88_36388 [Mikania micrantha]|uniref:Uncharacterized protein n=1 Tax=Mikania micrantha TaxID=192012 RepID=A0A5N6M451_9ASTR|nr:hypothetical protein E3N88_36388 [Mikania micrantha]
MDWHPLSSSLLFTQTPALGISIGAPTKQEAPPPFCFRRHPITPSDPHSVVAFANKEGNTPDSQSETGPLKENLLIDDNGNNEKLHSRQPRHSANTHSKPLFQTMITLKYLHLCLQIHILNLGQKGLLEDLPNGGAPGRVTESLSVIEGLMLSSSTSRTYDSAVMRGTTMTHSVASTGVGSGRSSEAFNGIRGDRLQTWDRTEWVPAGRQEVTPAWWDSPWTYQAAASACLPF